MGTEIYVNRFRKGEPLPFSPGAVEQSFSEPVAERQDGDLALRLGGPDEPINVVQFSPTRNDATAFAVERPLDDLRLYEALLSVLLQEGSVAYAPGSPPVVGVKASMAHLPEDMVASLGSPVVALSAAELRSLLFPR